MSEKKAIVFASFCLVCLGVSFNLLSSTSAGGENAPREEERIMIVTTEQEEEDGESVPQCPICPPAYFNFRLKETASFDVKNETDVEDILMSWLRVEAQFTIKKPQSRLSAKATMRFDFILSGKKRGGWVELSRSENRAELLEWYGEFDTAIMDLKVGSQFLKFARCSGFPIADYLSPFDLREVYRGEFHLPQLPVPAIRADLRASHSLTLTISFVPFFRQSRFDLWGTDEAIFGPNSPEQIQEMVALIDQVVDPSVSDRIRQSLIATKIPDEWGPNQSVGLRIENSGEEVDVGINYLFTFGPIPELRVNEDFLVGIYLFNSGHPDMAGTIISDIDYSRDYFITTEFRRMHIFSMDVTGQLGSVIITAESGWVPEAFFPAIDRMDDSRQKLPSLYNVKSGLFSSAVSLQYNYGELFYMNVELSYGRMLAPIVVGQRESDYEKLVKFLFGEREDFLLVLSAIRFEFLRGRLKIMATGRSDLLGRDLIASTTISYEVTGRIRLFAGCVFYEVFGKRPSPELTPAGGRDYNDEIFTGIELW